MRKSKLAISTQPSFDVSVPEQIRLFKEAGFDGFFTMWEDDGKIQEYRALADELGMEYQSVHAPFYKAADMWKADTEAEAATEELLRCVKDCHASRVPILVVHTFIGFDEHSPNENGIKNFGKVVDLADELGVKIAFENTEGEEYLDCLMEAFSDRDNVGFCLDTGHVMCYNRGRDMIRDYGNRLIATHLNDNLGISSKEGKIFWTDDLHLLPFDGIIDWELVAEKLSECGFDGTLTFELLRKSKPNRHENDKYAAMPIEEYLAEAYKAACRVATLKEMTDEKRKQAKNT